MSKKYDGISSLYIQKMLRSSIKAKDYEEEIKKIRKEYSFDKKEKFIEETKKSFVSDKFAEELAWTLRSYYYSFSTYGLSNAFEEIIEKYGGEVNALYYPISHGVIKKYGDKTVYYLFDKHSIGWEEEEVCVLTIPMDIDIFSFFNDLEELKKESDKRYEETRKRKEQEEKLAEKIAEKKEYEEYLRLKEKYEK